ncbi:uncharacterized protein LOC127149619 isoform X1 [Cucumis melo]|uniref:Uncharacterized protein LOC127149619 isoform X1 n=1 Tax=Cucumis melo TaxID=3656 RepID=A0ABM3KUC4_CUCME|nr:uncharacterized protein LOC127149619 isoform X1 [Cucumis melo]
MWKLPMFSNSVGSFLIKPSFRSVNHKFEKWKEGEKLRETKSPTPVCPRRLASPPLSFCSLSLSLVFFCRLRRSSSGLARIRSTIVVKLPSFARIHWSSEVIMVQLIDF